MSLKLLKLKENEVNRNILACDNLISLEKIVNDIGILQASENTMSSIITKYCEFESLNNVNKVLDIMEKTNKTFKNRTISPIIDLYYRLNNPDIINIYNNSRKWGVKLGDKEFSKIVYCLIKSKISYDKVVKDFSKHINTLNLDCFKILESEISLVNDIKLKKVDINNQIKDDILKFIDNSLMKNNLNFNKFKKYLKKLSINNNLIIIDGANIGYFNSRSTNYNLSFSNIDKVVKYYENMNKNILIILHNRHINRRKLKKDDIEKYNNWTKNKTIFLTPNNYNDDLYWLYATIYLSKFIECHLITNDKLKDHVFHIIQKHIDKFSCEIFNRFVNNYVVEYKFLNNNFVPNIFNESTICLQKIDDTWYLPFDLNKQYIYKFKI